MIVLVVVAALVALLAIVLVVNAVRLKPTPVPDPLPPSDARGDDGRALPGAAALRNRVGPAQPRR